MAIHVPKTSDEETTPLELRAALEATLPILRTPGDLPSGATEESGSIGTSEPSRLTLLELMKRRRSLPLREALVLLERIAAKLDLLQRAAQPCPALTLGDIIIEPPELCDWRLDECPTLTIALPGEYSREAAADATNATVVTGLNLAPESQTGPRVLAMLGYELLGGMRVESAGRWTPLPSLSAQGNAALRSALERGDAYESAAGLVAALRPDAKPSPRAAPNEAASRKLAVARSAETPNRAPSTKTTPHFAALSAVIGSSVIFVVLLIATGFWLRRPAAVHPPSTNPRPAPTQAETVTIAKPAQKKAAIEKPVPQEDPSAPFLRAAEEAKRRYDDAQAFENFSRALDASPGMKGPKEEMEMIAARLRSNAVQLTPEKFAVLQEPLELAAKHNVLSAQMLLGEGLRKNNPQAALKWFAAAAAQGQTEAMTQAGLMMANGLGNEAPDFSAAVAWFQQGAAGGDTDAMVSLADCLLHAKGIAKNEAQAVELLRAAAALNHPNAMNMLGDLLKKGVPGLLDANVGEAFRLFARAKEMGFLDAQANLGVMYVNGLGVLVDRDRAFGLWKDGAAQGNAMRMFFYAMALEGGLTGAPQPAEARPWYLESGATRERRCRGLMPPKRNPRRSGPLPLTRPGIRLVNARQNPLALPGDESQSASGDRGGGFSGDDFLWL